MTREQLDALLPVAANPGAEAKRRRAIDGIEDYLFIGGDEISVRQAADRLGVTPRTIQRWRRVLREAA